MVCWRRSSNRVQDDSKLEGPVTPDPLEIKHKEVCSISDCSHRGGGGGGLKKFQVLEPGGKLIQRWNMLFFTANVISLLVDPMYFLLPEARTEMCIQFSFPLELVLTILRSLTDFFYVIDIGVRFRTAYIDPSSRVTARGELVTDPWKIALKYLRFGFWIHLTAAFPIPQVLSLGILPNLKGSSTSNSKTFLWFIILIQMLLRFSLVYPLSLQVAKSSGVITEKAWVAAAYNLMFYLLASIVSGNCWYLLSIQRQEACWRSVCAEESLCVYWYFDCTSLGDPSRDTWLQSTNVTNNCNPANNVVPFGIFSYAITVDISSGGFLSKFSYCLWWGIRNLSSQGQNLLTSIDLIENIFCYIIGALGLVLLAFFIGNMQKYIQSDNKRLEMWRIKRSDFEQWMHHRQLPKELRQSVLRYHKYKWVATQGVDEEAIFTTLPTNLRRQTKRYLCLNLVRKVPVFHQLDDGTLDAICERLKPVLCTRGMYLLHEGDQMNEMVIIIRGHLYSYTTDGGRTGFFNSSTLGPNDLCGEELLTWALDARHSQLDILPSSTRTVKAISDMEGFSLGAEDLRFIALQFRRMHSRELRHKLRFYSQPWRIWAASFIQAAWHRHKRRKKLAAAAPAPAPAPAAHDHDQLPTCSSSSSSSVVLLYEEEEEEESDTFVPRPDAGIEAYAARLMADHHVRQAGGSKRILTQPNPTQPNPSN